MKFEIPFNTEFDFKEKQFLWKYGYDRKVKKAWFLIIISIAPLLLLLFVQNGNFIYILLIAALLGSIFAQGLYLISIEKYKKKYFQSFKARALTLENSIVTFEFNDDSFTYSDKYVSSQISWSEFECSISSPNISLMKRKYTEAYFVMISRIEFGDDNYQRIVEFLKTKIPQQSF